MFVAVAVGAVVDVGTGVLVAVGTKVVAVAVATNVVDVGTGVLVDCEVTVVLVGCAAVVAVAGAGVFVGWPGASVAVAGAGVYVGWPGAVVGTAAEEPAGVDVADALFVELFEEPDVLLDAEPVLARACATPPVDPSTCTAPSATADPRPLLTPSLPLVSISPGVPERRAPLLLEPEEPVSLSSDELWAAAA